jgi:hypothetical protein
MIFNVAIQPDLEQIAYMEGSGKVKAFQTGSNREKTVPAPFKPVEKGCFHGIVAWWIDRNLRPYLILFFMKPISLTFMPLLATPGSVRPIANAGNSTDPRARAQ